MNANNSISSNLISIIGYGTFITRNLWKDKANVEVCLIKNFRRIFPKGTWFPYALRSKGSFKALKFDVTKEELKILDQIEGVYEGLFERIIVDIYLENDIKSSAFMYVPTDETIKSQKLSLELDKFDRWKEEIKKSPEVVRFFPKLLI
ncbi:MAG: gamma-glutamylcyclotransferase family protein [Promethearchaeota archaeon]